VLFRILSESEAFMAVTFQEILQSEALWSRAIAERYSLDPAAPAAVVGAAVVTAFRLAWQAFSSDPGLDPVGTITAYLRMFNVSFPGRP
jgi:hypothetical protein